MMIDRPSETLIRLYCDGELSPEQTIEFRRWLEQNPTERDRISQRAGLENKFRQHISSAMRSQCPAAPGKVLAEIQSRMAVATMEISSGASRPHRSVVGRLFLSTQRANVLAIAATLALVAGAVLFGIFGRPIDDLSDPGAGDVVEAAAVYASEEHDQTSSNPQALALKEQAAIDAETDLTEWLGVPVQVFDLEPMGYQFVGACKCDMKIQDRSGHLIYRSTREGQRKPMVSIFIAPYSGQCGSMCKEMEAGKWLSAARKSMCRHNVLFSTDRRLVYFLVCCNEGDLEKLTSVISQSSLKAR